MITPTTTTPIARTVISAEEEHALEEMEVRQGQVVKSLKIISKLNNRLLLQFCIVDTHIRISELFLCFCLGSHTI